LRLSACFVPIYFEPASAKKTFLIFYTVGPAMAFLFVSAMLKNPIGYLALAGIHSCLDSDRSTGVAVKNC
jgi:hypothetical protein